MLRKIVNAFSVPVLEAEFDNISALSEKLKENIYQLFDNMDDKRLLSYEWDNRILTDSEKPRTGYSSFDHSNLKDDPNFTEFFQLVSPLITEFLEQLGYLGNWEFENSWANVYPKGAWVPHHNHGTSHWSGVFYVQAPANCGNLLLIDPKEYALSNEPDNTKWRGNHKMIVPVTTGKLAMFPGYLKHESKPNESVDDRIIISFNIKTE